MNTIHLFRGTAFAGAFPRNPFSLKNPDMRPQQMLEGVFFFVDHGKGQTMSEALALSESNRNRDQHMTPLVIKLSLTEQNFRPGFIHHVTFIDQERTKAVATPIEAFADIAHGQEVVVSVARLEDIPDVSIEIGTFDFEARRFRYRPLDRIKGEGSQENSQERF